jgi:IS30 family transposase
MNKLLRQYIPKNQEITKYNTLNLKEIQTKINNRPRKNLDFEKPVAIFYNFINQKVAFAG